MKKEFVTYEQAVALKELGFDEECFAIYDEYKESSEKAEQTQKIDKYHNVFVGELGKNYPVNIDVSEMKKNSNELDIINSLIRNRVIRMKTIVSEINIIVQEQMNEKKIEYVNVFDNWSKIKNYLHAEKLDKTNINLSKNNFLLKMFIFKSLCLNAFSARYLSIECMRGTFFIK